MIRACFGVGGIYIIKGIVCQEIVLDLNPLTIQNLLSYRRDSEPYEGGRGAEGANPEEIRTKLSGKKAVT